MFLGTDHDFFTSKVKMEKTTDVYMYASKDMWIYGATPIHLAAKFMPKGLELMLSSLEENNRLVDIRSQYNCTPLHVAASNSDALSTRY